MDNAPPVFISGTFDVDNYGDCLFPFIAARRLEQCGFKVVPLSPTKQRPRWTDAKQPISFADAMSTTSACSGIVIGGGNIIHNRHDSLKHYVTAGVSEIAYASLWIGATLLGAQQNVPIVWNSPGVPREFSPSEQEGMLPDILGAANYISVRDEFSKRNLGPTVEHEISLVPDSAAELSKVWTRELLEETFRTILQRKNVQADKRFIAIHVKERAGGIGIPKLAAMLDMIAEKTSLAPIILALAPCHGDDHTARSLAHGMKCDHVLLDDARELKEIAAAIAFSDVYVGASLHGYITNYAYGNSGMIVAQPPIPKFAGFLQHAGREMDLASDWDVALERLCRLRYVKMTAASEGIARALDTHWATIASAFVGPVSKRPSNYLSKFTAAGIRAGGVRWSLEPHLATDTGRNRSIYEKIVMRISRQLRKTSH